MDEHISKKVALNEGREKEVKTRGAPVDRDPH